MAERLSGDRSLAQRAMQSRLLAPVYERAWRLDASLIEAFLALTRLYRRTERWDALAELVLRRAEHTRDHALAGALLRQASEVFEERLGNPQAAITTLESLPPSLASQAGCRFVPIAVEVEPLRLLSWRYVGQSAVEAARAGASILPNAGPRDRRSASTTAGICRVGAAGAKAFMP